MISSMKYSNQTCSVHVNAHYTYRSFARVCYRTLLALGCHVGLADEHAVEKVKSMKLSAA